MKIQLEEKDILAIQKSIRDWLGLELTSDEVSSYIDKNQYLLADFHTSIRNQVVCDMGMKLMGTKMPV